MERGDEGAELPEVAAGPTLRVGTDLQDIAAVEQSVRTLGARYVDRVFTPHEQESAGYPSGAADAVAPGLAARFAAKEAAIKVLRPVNEAIGWRDIEVRRHEGGWCSLALTGAAAELADRARLGSLALSFSHGAGFAVATVIATEAPAAGSILG